MNGSNLDRVVRQEVVHLISHRRYQGNMRIVCDKMDDPLREAEISAPGCFPPFSISFNNQAMISGERLYVWLRIKIKFGGHSQSATYIVKC